MRIFLNELYKLFSKKIFIICIVTAICINGFVLHYSATTDYVLQSKQHNINYYNSLIKKCNNSNKPKQFLENELKSINTSSKKDNKTKENNLEKATLITDLIAQQDYIDGYDDYINNMQSRADNQLSFSIFAEPGSFAYRNIEQTPLDFQKLKGVTLQVGNNTCVEQATQFNITDYLLLVIVVIITIILFCVEKEKGLYPLVRSTKKGRVNTIIAKLLTVVFVTLISAIIFYSSNILISGFYFGFGDMSRNIQSISSFINCSLKINISEYLIIWIIGKALTLCTLSLLVSLGFVVFKTIAKMYGIIVVFLAVEISSSLFISSNSTFSFFKYVNVYYFLSENNLFGNYLNVNIFNQPVNIITIWLLFIAIFSIISFVISTIVFTKSTQTANKSILINRISQLISNKSKIKGSTKIYSGEAFKHYKTSFALFIIILLSIFAISTYCNDISIHFNDASESAYNVYMQKLEGKIDSNTNSILNKEQKYFDNLNEKKNKIYSNSKLTLNEKNSEAGYIDSLLESKGVAFDNILQQKQYATEKSKEINTEPYLINDFECKRLVEDTYREWLYFTLIMAVVIFCTSNIFSCEYKNSMINLLRSNRYGKGRLIKVKLITVLITSVVSYILIYLPYLLKFISTFGKGIFEIPLAYMSDFSMLKSSITVGEYIFIVGMVHLFATIAITSVVFMLSLILKSNVLTMIISSGMVLIPCIAVMEVPSFRLVQTFQDNNWIVVTAVILILCVIFTFLAIAIVSYKFMNKRRREVYAKT